MYKSTQRFLIGVFMCGLLLAGGSGARAAVMSIGNVTDLGGGAYALSTGTGAVSDSAIEIFLGLAPGTLDGISTGNATEGSALKDTLSLIAGEPVSYSFDWLWSSNEGSGSSFNDFAFVSLSFSGMSQAEVFADTFTPDGTTGTEMFSGVSPFTGLLTIGIGVLDVSDSIVDSFLNISNISKGESASVPEPLTLVLLGMGLLGLGLSRRRRR